MKKVLEKQRYYESLPLVQAIIQNIPVGIALFRGPEFICELVNPAFQAFVPGGELISEVWPEPASQILPNLKQVLEWQKTYYTYDVPCQIRRTPEGPSEEAYFTFVYVPVNIPGDPPAVLVLAIETTRGKQAERNLQIANRALRAFSACNQALVRTTEESRLLQEICRVIVETAGYRLAWVGIAEHDERKTVRPIAQMGFEAGYLQTVNITWADEERGRGPTGSAIRTGKPSIVRNMMTDPSYAPWREEALRRGYASSIALPLVSNGQVFGALSIYAREPDAFDEEEVKLLMEMAGDLAYGITALRIRAEHKRAEEALRASEELFHSLVDNMLDGAIILDWDGVVLFANCTAARLIGLDSPEKAAGLTVLNFVHPDYKKPLLNDLALVREDRGGFLAEYRLQATKGEEAWIEAIGSKIRFKNDFADLVTFRNISERKRGEKVLANNIDNLRLTLAETVNALSVTSELRDPYTAGHQRRVAQLACAIVKDLGLYDDCVKAMAVIAGLHDIGKINVPAEILTKPSRLTDIEMALVRAHPQASYDILRNIPFPWPVAKAILQHHERLDGSGYPQGLSGNDIILEARILAVADVVEAMSSHRPYRPAQGLDQALDEISKQKGILYDPEAVDSCLKLFRKEGFAFE